MSNKRFNETNEHKILIQAAQNITHLRELIETPGRFEALSRVFENTLFDFSKQRITPEILNSLTDLANACDLDGWRKKFFAGEKINNTENRAVMHMACRAPADIVIELDGRNVVPDIQAELNRMKEFANAIRREKKITHVVNIGIGGSDLGPRFVTEALKAHHDGPEIRFVSNIDGQDLEFALDGLDPHSTLFVIASKTFTTQETMTNAASAKKWFLGMGMKETDIADHFVALSTNGEKVGAFGIDTKRMFKFADWVGGRYSVWSPIGLSIMLATGPDHFQEFLNGAHAADEHFKTAPLDKNISVILGMIGIWNRNYLNYPTLILAPYDTRLIKLGKFIQQMDMESNGKSVDRDGRAVDYETGPQIYGETGTDSQHSYMQLVHQGTDIIPLDFIIAAKPHHKMDAAHHRLLMANMQAQTRALARGQTLNEAKGDPHRIYAGNRPSTTIILPELTPYTLGMLIALYEHKVFVQGIIWNLNSYDQPGVELGKTAANFLIPCYEAGKINPALDQSTKGQMSFLGLKA